ncbi:hypothetical protein MCUN1_003739 [Malassezia cuniculi]|uniref:Mediator of RNA polymerase II transcription subunit 7 n=1 Tax=Malassezia cuniculi TaxID=948313 RepID=A0AAF0EX95_9BASI|nr:hypothetical protein MCUN1_003739 [Malassezia cuniculi]
MAETETLGSTAIFPPPPAVFRRFTEANMLWLAALHDVWQERAKEAASDQMEEDSAADAPAVADPWLNESPERRIELQSEALKSVSERLGVDAPDFDLAVELTPPHIDWIEQDGGYTIFGRRWPLPEVTPSLDELGITRLFPENLTDRREELQKLLRTLLQTYFELTNDLLRPMQPYDVFEPAPAGTPGGFWVPSSRIQDRIKHMETTVINIQYLLNQLRPHQARRQRAC